MFNRKTQAPTKANVIDKLLRDLTDAIKAAHEGGLSFRTIAETLEHRAQGERISDATSSRPASTRYDALTLRPIVD
jgi:hypothetical protein